MAKAPKLVVKVACKGAAELPLEKLVGLQGDMKRLTQGNYEKLRSEIAERGFSFPVAVWLGPDKRARILDGHQRVETLKRMRGEGYKIPDLPVVFVQAANEQEARRKLLAAASQYGEFDLGSLRGFLDAASLDLGETQGHFALPGIDLKGLFGGIGEVVQHADGDVGITMRDGIEAFNNSSLRQIMLVFTPEEFEEAVAFLSRVKDEQHLETNNDAVMWLLRKYAEARATKKTSRHEKPSAALSG